MAIAVGVLIVSGGRAFAADKPVFAPPAAWVDVAPIPKVPVGNGPSVEMLLDDNQARFGPDGDELYNRRVIRIARTDGLAGAVTREVSWDPETDKVIIHTLKIIRDGQTIDLLGDGSKMLVLRRETNLERAMIDGRLTASEQIPGLQVGDVLDWSYTEVTRDPVMKGNSEAYDSVDHAGRAGRVRIRYLWPDSRPMRWKAGKAFTPMVSHRGGWTEMLIDETDVLAPKAPVAAPKRYSVPGEVEITSFQNWAEVSALMAPLYTKSEQLEPNSPLLAEIERIKAATPDPKKRASAALALVEDKTRYLFIGLDSGGFTPATADETWRRRFGDCKGKTVLLLALLHGLGIEAQPVLVATEETDLIGAVLPTLRFDHVLVRAQIDGASYWMDGTRTGDDEISTLEPPGYRYGLTVADRGGALITIDQHQLLKPQIDGRLYLDASAGLDQPIVAEVRLIMTGEFARAGAALISRAADAETKQQMKTVMSRSFGWMDIKDVSWSGGDNSFNLVLRGTADLPWRDNPDLGVRELRLPGAATIANATQAFPIREPGPDADAPYAAPFPLYIAGVLDVTLPDGGRGFSVRGVNTDTVVGPFHIIRSAKMDGGVARFRSEITTTGPEFPAAAAAQANRDLRRLGDMEEFVRAPRSVGAENSGAGATTQPQP